MISATPLVTNLSDPQVSGLRFETSQSHKPLQRAPHQNQGPPPGFGTSTLPTSGQSLRWFFEAIADALESLSTDQHEVYLAGEHAKWVADESTVRFLPPADLPPNVAAIDDGPSPASRQPIGFYAADGLRVDFPVRLTDKSDRPEAPEEALQKEIDEKFALYETLEPGWDSYSAEPLNRDSLLGARKFLGMRPKDIRLPHPQLGSDGIVSLYWVTTRVFANLSFDGNGLLSYHAQQVVSDGSLRELFGEDCPFANGWPRELLAVLRKM